MLYIISLEPLETRYTAQWQRWFKEEFPESIEIAGDTLSELQNNKNFLNPFHTNIWKSEQIIKISNLFRENKINSGDKFLFLDAWHYGVIALRYMASLSDIDIKIYGLWHAGSYDDYDLLGLKGLFSCFGSFEKSLFGCLDKSFVATQFHENLIFSKFKEDIYDISITGSPYKFGEIVVTGFPYRFEELDKYGGIRKKENIVIFPHRLSEEKQPEILKDLEKDLEAHNIKCIFCQETKLSKDEYHKLLAKSKICFSASLQETWGLGTFEALYLDCIPVIPRRLSYTEMYNNCYLYPDCYTNHANQHNRHHRDALLSTILEKISYYNYYLSFRDDNINFLKENYCTFKNIRREMGE